MLVACLTLEVKTLGQPLIVAPGIGPLDTGGPCHALFCDVGFCDALSDPAMP